MVTAGALAAGFVSGLAGFGTGLVALGFWLHAIDPVLAAPLVAICSVVGQVQSLVSLRRSVRLGRLEPQSRKCQWSGEASRRRSCKPALGPVSSNL